MSVDPAALGRLIVEPLDRARHDRSGFACGVPRIDNYFRHTAAKHADRDFAKVYVACEPGSTAVAGFFAIAPHAIEIAALPERDRKRMPNRETVPAFYLSMIAVDSAFQGRGLGTLLLSSALRKCVSAADIAGGHFVVLDAIDARAARLYRRAGFAEIPSRPGRMLIGMRALRRAVALADMSTAQPA